MRTLTDQEVGLLMRAHTLESQADEVRTQISALKNREEELRGRAQDMRLDLVARIGRPIGEYEIESVWRINDGEKTDAGAVAEEPTLAEQKAAPEPSA